MSCRTYNTTKGFTMTTRPRAQGASGYSLIELLVVLAIVGILSIVGVSMLGNRGGNSVRVVLDELEGAVMDAHKYASSTGRDVAIVTRGAWNTNVTTPTMLMARGVATQIDIAGVVIQTDTAIFDVVDKLLLPTPVIPTTDSAKSVAITFAPSRSREYMNAGVVVAGSAWWGNAMQATSSGKQNQDLTTVAPFNSDAAFITANTAANNLFRNVLNTVTISGSNKRFNSSFNIQVVGTSGGFAIPGGAMGLLVVLNNGATVYKFYNPGVNNGDGQWRRI